MLKLEGAFSRFLSVGGTVCGFSLSSALFLDAFLFLSGTRSQREASRSQISSPCLKLGYIQPCVRARWLVVGICAVYYKAVRTTDWRAEMSACSDLIAAEPALRRHGLTHQVRQIM